MYKKCFKAFSGTHLHLTLPVFLKHNPQDMRGGHSHKCIVLPESLIRGEMYVMVGMRCVIGPCRMLK